MTTLSKAQSRTGSSMSTKQFARAVAHGRKVAFRFIRGEHSTVLEGYVVGMDDYHILLATLEPNSIEPDSISVRLVAKGRADITTLSPDSTLDAEPELVQKAVEEVGRGFIAYCRRTALGEQGGEDS